MSNVFPGQWVGEQLGEQVFLSPCVDYHWWFFAWRARESHLGRLTYARTRASVGGWAAACTCSPVAPTSIKTAADVVFDPLAHLLANPDRGSK